GEDERKAPRAQEECEAACYDCLMNYSNQRDHSLLDRQKIRELLLEYAQATVTTAPAVITRSEHLEELKRQADSDLERDWLDFLEERNHRLPAKAQVFIEACKTRPDFMFEKESVAVYIDGPHHQFPDRNKRDAVQTDCMEDRGYTVIRFGLADDWADIIRKY